MSNVWKEKKKDAMEVMFKIDDILSDKEKLFNTETAKELQKLLNMYVLGDDELSLDGQVGHKTLNAITEYKEQKKYWMGNGAIRVNPMHTYDRYKIITNKNLDTKVRASKLDSVDKHHDEIEPGLYEY